MDLNEVYEKYKHLDGLLSNPIDNTSINLTARDLWLAVKEAAQQSVQPTDDGLAQSDGESQSTVISG